MHIRIFIFLQVIFLPSVRFCTNEERAMEEMLTIDRTYIEKTYQKHCKTSTVLEPVGKEE
uniref:Uncharacterized protein n=1 Tax=Arion vulgaris TaxID=1028688 RepID=A0A0B7ATJ5_9EUPU